VKTYSTDTAIGRALIAIGSAGADGLTGSQLDERIVGGKGVGGKLVRLGLAERVTTDNGEGYRLTDAGKAARPSRNPMAAIVIPPVRKSLAETIRQPLQKGNAMDPETRVRVTSHLPNRPHIAAYEGRVGTVKDHRAFKLLHGFVAVALDNRDGSAPSKRPILILFHQDELEVLTPESIAA